MLSFSPGSLAFTAAVGSAGPQSGDLDLANPIPFPAHFPQALHSDPAPQATTLTATVEAAGGPFSVRDVILFDVGFVRIFDPDVGKFVRFKALTFAGSRDGPGPVDVVAGQVVVVRVVFAAGPAAGTATQRLVLAAPASDATVVPLSLTTFVPPVQ